MDDEGDEGLELEGEDNLGEEEEREKEGTTRVGETGLPDDAERSRPSDIFGVEILKDEPPLNLVKD